MTGRDRMILVVLCVAAVLVAPWLLVVSPKRSEASKLQSQVTAAQSQLAKVRSEASQAAAARGSYASSYATLVRLGEAVPTDDNTPSLIYQLQSAASAAHVDFQSLTFNAGQAASSSAPPPAAPAASSSSASSSSAPASTSPSASQASTAALPPGATVGPAGFPVEPFTFTFQGSFFHLADFLGRLQRFVVMGNQRLSVSGRLMTLNAISLGPSTSSFPQITATISASTYLLPASQGLLNGATPSGPSSSSTQTVSTPSSSASPAPAVVATPVR
jgi:type II secretory pathway pseudopilin PulG